MSELKIKDVKKVNIQKVMDDADKVFNEGIKKSDSKFKEIIKK